MSFNSDEFKAILTDICNKTYSLLSGSKRLRKDDHMVAMCWRPACGDPFYMYSTHLIGPSASKSSHRRLAEEKFRIDCRTTVDEILSFLRREIPALDVGMLGVNLEIREPTKSGQPRIKFDILGHSVTSGPVTLKTMVKKVTAIAQNMSPAVKPGDRKFLINDRTYFARDAYDAMRIHCALAMPEYFVKAPALYPHITVSEIVPSGPLFESIFRSCP